MVSYFWCFTFLVCVLIQNSKINTQEIKSENRSILGNLFRKGANLKLQAADEIDDALGQFRGLLGIGTRSVLSNLQQITKTVSTGIQNTDTAVKNGLEAAKDGAYTSYLVGRAVPKTTVDLANLGMKSLQDLISSPTKETN